MGVPQDFRHRVLNELKAIRQEHENFLIAFGGALDIFGRQLKKDLLEIMAKEVKLMASVQDIVDRVTAQTSVVEAVRVLVEDLKAHQDDPAKLQEIVTGLDANNTALAAIANTGTPPPTP